jgi:hypothetical protein
MTPVHLYKRLANGGRPACAWARPREAPLAWPAHKWGTHMTRSIRLLPQFSVQASRRRLLVGSPAGVFDALASSAFLASACTCPPYRSAADANRIDEPPMEPALIQTVSHVGYCLR